MPPTTLRKRGRKPLDPSGRQTTRPVKLSPDEATHLATHYGSVNAGVRALVIADIKKRAGREARAKHVN